MLALSGRDGRRPARRAPQSWIKRAFNIAQFALCGVVALTVFHLIAEPVAMPGPREWVAALAAAAATSVLGAILVATVISLSGGAPQFTKLPEMIRFSSMVALANASLALLAVMVLWIDRSSIFLLAVPVAIVFLAYRAYVGEREKHERLELLYESSRLLHYTPELDAAIVALVEHARRMFRAESVTLVLCPKRRDERGGPQLDRRPRRHGDHGPHRGGARRSHPPAHHDEPRGVPGQAGGRLDAGARDARARPPSGPSSASAGCWAPSSSSTDLARAAASP